MAGVFGLIVSAAYIGLTCLIAWWARQLTERLQIQSNVKKILLLEAIATWELCAACFELIIVADNYGVSTYALFLFVLTIWWSRNWGDATACPYTHFEDVAEGREWIGQAILKILAQLAGGLLTYGYTQYLWSLEVSANHRGRAYEACTADLQVPAVIGAVIEGVATCACRLASRFIAEINPTFGTELDAFIGTSLVVAAFNYSGGYFNPALATSLKLGCDGHTPEQHFFVYWIGSTVGALASVYLYKDPEFRAKVFAMIDKNKTA
ncbi:aquaporin rerated protein, invertebrate [Nesidiocoris tenuis]|uniref:Aquaporin n=1 Tax=Nesidiocoris tenuis TaxID=355587 RepID=A0ABN7AJF4_9HEMI|nr:aquaporin rerated protein, invertebrate [Nesidiocoris tenuis]